MQKKKNTKLVNQHNIESSSVQKEFLDENFLPHKKWEENHKEDNLYTTDYKSIYSQKELSEDSLSDDDEIKFINHFWSEHFESLEQHKFSSFDLIIKQREKLALENTLEKNSIIENTEDTNYITIKKWKKTEKKHKKSTHLNHKTVKAKKRKSTILIDIIIIIVCLIGAYFSIKQFFLEINKTLEKENEQPIATITFKQNTAQRKLSDRVLWDRLQQESPIYNGDIIRTSELSEATITFIDNNQIDLYDQTLAQVFFDEEKGTLVDFSGGSIALSSDNSEKGITLVSGDTTVEISTGTNITATMAPVTDASDTKSTNSSLAVQVESGKANLIVKGQEELAPQSVTLTKGTALEIFPDGNIQEPQITVQYPENNARYLHQTTDTIPVTFEWTNNQEDTSLELQLSQKNDFSIIDKRIDISEINKTNVDMQDGNWYWQIIDNSNNKLAFGKFKVLNAFTPYAITPINEDIFHYRTQIPSIRFLWADNGITSEWRFEIADNKDIKNPIIVQNTSQPSSIVSTLGSGTWYWRITPIYSKSMIALENFVQPINSFTIQQKEELEPAILTSPANKQLVNLKKEQKFTWQFDRDAEYYTIFISENKDLSNPLIKESIKSNYFTTFAVLNPGTWYWAITKTDSEGNISKISDTKSFLALNGVLEHYLTTPENAYFISESKNSDLEFNWNSNIPYESKLQISKDKSFINLLHSVESTSHTVKDLEIPAGTCYWRVITENKEHDIYYETQPNILFIDFEINDPTIKSPINNYKQVFEPDTPALFISWDTVKNADYYEFKLYHKSNYKTPVYQDLFLSQSNIRLNMKSRERGNYFYTVRAVSESTASGNIVKSNITRRDFSTRDLLYIQLEKPYSGIEINGLDGLLNPMSVEWSSKEKVAKSEFILSKDGEIVMQIQNPENTIKLPQMKAGTWQWTINGTNTEGYDIGSPRKNTIIVNKIPLLSATKNTIPKQDTVFDMNYFISNDSIEFDWDEVPTAEEYIFTLKDSSNKILIKKEFTDTTSFVFSNIELLDRGVFKWEVEAIRYLPNYEQRGVISTQTFIIDLPSIEKAENITSGDLYGN